MSKNSTTDVLIVGAGPTGLMLACQLSSHSDVSFRIIDKNQSRTNQSRAILVHARTLEAFAQLNLFDKVTVAGQCLRGNTFYVNGRICVYLNYRRLIDEMNYLHTQYPYIYVMEQSETERILEDYLNGRGIFVERKTELDSFQDIESADGPKIQATLNTGEVITSRYLCGCDGSHSIVRQQLNIPFEGNTYSESLFVIDCKTKNLPVPMKEMALFVGYSGSVVAFPLANDRHRIFGTLHDSHLDEGEMTVDTVTRIFRERSKYKDFAVLEHGWLSTYRSHSRMVTSFSHGSRYFLIGDAAHIHSPVGGQGMNLGLEDSRNLAWKLVFSMRKSANQRLLDSYHDERFEVAKSMLKNVGKAHAILTSKHWLFGWYRILILPIIFRMIVWPLYFLSKKVRRKYFLAVSQLGISYRPPKIVDDTSSSGKFFASVPHPGDSFPYLIFDNLSYHLLVFEESTLPGVSDFINMVTSKYFEIIKVHENNSLQKLPFDVNGSVLIRPDGYVAYRTSSFDQEHFQKYLRRYFS